MRITTPCLEVENGARNNTALYGMLAFVVAALLIAGMLLVVSEWRFFYTLWGGAVLSALLILCVFLRRRAAMEYTGTVLTGILVFLPDMIFGTNSFLYECFFLWFVLSVLWALPSERTVVRLWPFIVLNLTLCSFGWQYVLPIFEMKAENFCALAAVLNLSVLVLRNFSLQRTDALTNSVFCFTPMLFASLFLIAGTAMQIVSGGGGFSFLYGFLYMLFLGVLFFRENSDAGIDILFHSFVLCWGGLSIYDVLGKTELSEQTALALFACAESLLIVLLLVFKNGVSFRTEERTDVD